MVDANELAERSKLAVGSLTGAPALRSSRIRSRIGKRRSWPLSSRILLLSLLMSAPLTSLRAAASNALAHSSERARKSCSLLLPSTSVMKALTYFGSVVSGRMRSFAAATASTVATFSGRCALKLASRCAEASPCEKAPTSRKRCLPPSSGSSATANELLSTMMPWQSGWSCVSPLSSVHALLTSALSPDSVISSTSVGRQPSSPRALAVALSRSARCLPSNGVEVA
eukprot:scaffold171949_cov27-Tisochrysis_lutea.AAC.2